jgi:hypothetical protein
MSLDCLFSCGTMVEFIALFERENNSHNDKDEKQKQMQMEIIENTLSGVSNETDG